MTKLSCDMTNYLAREVGYQAGSGNRLALEVQVHVLKREDVPIVVPEDVSVMCGSCKGLNGGCAQFAPYFEHIKPSKSHIMIIDVAMDMAWAIKYAYAAPGWSSVRNNYFRSGYADILTDRYLRRLVDHVVNNTGLYGLGVGHCAGCRSKALCTVLRGEACINPQARRYSIEATGVECSALCEQLHGSRLSWWHRASDLPAMMRRFGGVFLSLPMASEAVEWVSQAIQEHKSYVPLEEVPPRPDYEMEMLDVPADATGEAGEYLAYVNIDGAV